MNKNEFKNKETLEHVGKNGNTVKFSTKKILNNILLRNITLKV